MSPAAGASGLDGAQKAIINRVTAVRWRLLDEEAKLVHELYGESVITDAFMEEVRGHLQGFTGATLWNKFTKVLGLPMSEVERFNRASSALAAFRAARNGKLKQQAKEKYGVRGEQANYDQAKEFATDVVRDAHFVYGKSNLPEFMRSNTAGRSMASLYTFRTFTHNMIAMWALGAGIARQRRRCVCGEEHRGHNGPWRRYRPALLCNHYGLVPGCHWRR